MRRCAYIVSDSALIGALLVIGLVGPQVIAPALAHAGQGRPIANRSAPEQKDETAAKVTLKPEVQALINTSTNIYKNMKSYQHTADFVLKSGREGAAKETTYTLAIERPNHFCYRSDDSTDVAAICDGKVFYNLKSSKQYMRSLAPASYKDLNIVDDVTFNPIGTYFIALMVQGNVLADRDVRTALANASAPTAVTEDGKKYDTLVVQIGENSPATTLYFDAQTHLLHKAVTKNDNERTTEIIENVKVNAPIPPALFQYTPPKDALLLTRADRPRYRLRAHSINVRL